MRRLRRAVLLAASLVVAALLGGCGSKNSASEALSAGVLRVGTEGTYAPFSYHDPGTGQLAGYDVDVARAVADKLGVKVEFVETPWDSIFAALEAGRFDVVANQVTITPERRAKYDMSEPYSVGEGVIVTRADDTSINSLADLKGKTAAQSMTSNWAKVAKDAGANVEAVEGFTQAIKLLNQGRVQAVVNDSIAVYAYLAETGDTSVKIAAETGEKSDQGFAARKDSGLLPDLNKALEELRTDGTLAQISERYLKANATGSPDPAPGSRRSTWQLIADNLLPLAKAAITMTIPLTIISFVIGLLIALVVALARLSHNPVLNGVARLYVSIIRGTPLLVQLFIVFYALPELGITGRAPKALLARYRAQSSMVFQAHNLFPHKTVLQNVIEGPLVVQKRPADDILAEARQLLDRVGLADKERRLPLSALRRSAAAGGHRPRAGHAAEVGAVRRTHLGPGSRTRG